MLLFSASFPSFTRLRLSFMLNGSRWSKSHKIQKKSLEYLFDQIWVRVYFERFSYNFYCLELICACEKHIPRHQHQHQHHRRLLLLLFYILDGWILFHIQLDASELTQAKLWTYVIFYIRISGAPIVINSSADKQKRHQAIIALSECLLVDMLVHVLFCIHRKYRIGHVLLVKENDNIDSTISHVKS